MYMLQLGIVKLAKLGTNTRLPFLAILVPSAGNGVSPASKTVIARQLGNNTGVYTQDHIWNNSFLEKTVTRYHIGTNSFSHTIAGDLHVTSTAM